MSPIPPETVTSATLNGDTHVTQPVTTRKYPYGEADASREPASLNALVWKEALQEIVRLEGELDAMLTLLRKQRRSLLDHMGAIARRLGRP
jgi:hypothetical protein